MGGGQDNPAGLTSPPGGKINQPGYVAPPGVKVTRVGGRISRDRLPPGGQANHGWLTPRGATCPGGKINWDTCTGGWIIGWGGPKGMLAPPPSSYAYGPLKPMLRCFYGQLKIKKKNVRYK